ncbi:MAG: ABC transporter ATP-binding protein, partial [Prevotella sp.]|nr:ABC transporter ATP-binding protein [Prevotellaceae bacterium]MDY5342703.1 ABC transporter ATP-binding protein [Prevotella sp.]
MNSIEIKDLSIGYDAHSKKIKTVASQLNGRLNEGRLTCLLGANGVGKSTLLKTLSGFLPKLQGNILIGNKDIEDYSDKELAKLIGVVLTAKPEIQNMTAREMVALGRSPYTGFWGSLGEEDNHIVDKAIEMVGIEAL